MNRRRLQQTAQYVAVTAARQIRRVVDVPVLARRGFGFGRTLRGPELVCAPAPPGALESYVDSHTEGAGLWKWRHYFAIYERHLGRFVGRAPTIVEIGIFSGGSLGMWQSYFGPGTHIHGVDIQEACTAHASDAVTVWIGDQSDPLFWKRFLLEVPTFDIVIDDGGHEALQQIPTLEALLPRLRPGGVYICEDVHGEAHSFHSYVDGLARNLHTVGPPHADGGHIATGFQQAISSIHRYPFMTVVETHQRTLERLVAPKQGTEWEPFYGSAADFPTNRAS